MRESMERKRQLTIDKTLYASQLVARSMLFFFAFDRLKFDRLKKEMNWKILCRKSCEKESFEELIG